MLKLIPDWFHAGGPVMWVILVGSLLTVWVFFEKLWSLRRRGVVQPDVARTVQALARADQLEEALGFCRSNPGPYASIAAAALEAAPHGPEEVRQAVLAAGRQEGARLERYLPAVKTVASVSPLLGLFGTVLGMIQVFAAISTIGLGQAEQLSAGIQQALLTTAFGLGVAIPSLIIHNAVQGRVDRLLLKMEADVILLVSTLVRSDAVGRAASAVSTERSQGGA